MKQKVYNPFKALNYYENTAEDIELFFGRSTEKIQLAQKITQNRLLLLFGKSGTGKSSLINAGIIPQIDEQFLAVRLRSTNILEEEDFLTRIREQFAEEGTTEELTNETFSVPNNLWEYLGSRHFFDIDGQRKAPCLILDQFEEIFNTDPSMLPGDAKEFLSQLASIIEMRMPNAIKSMSKDQANKTKELVENVRVIIGCREEALADLESLKWQMPSIMKSGMRYRLRRFDRESAMEVLQKAGKGFFKNPKAREKLLDVIEVKNPLERRGKDIYEPFLLSLYAYQLVEDRWREVSKAKWLFFGRPNIDGTKKGWIKGHEIRESHINLEAYQKRIKQFYKEKTRGIGFWTKRVIWNDLITEEGRRLLFPYDVAKGKLFVSEESLKELENRKVIRIPDMAGNKYIELIHDTLIDTVKAEKEWWKGVWRVGGIAVAIAVLVGGILVSLWFLQREQERADDFQRQRDIATVATEAAKKAQKQAELDRTEAENQKSIAEQEKDKADSLRIEAERQKTEAEIATEQARKAQQDEQIARVKAEEQRKQATIAKIEAQLSELRTRVLEFRAKKQGEIETARKNALAVVNTGLSANEKVDSLKSYGNDFLAARRALTSFHRVPSLRPDTFNVLYYNLLKLDSALQEEFPEETIIKNFKDRVADVLNTRAKEENPYTQFPKEVYEQLVWLSREETNQDAPRNQDYISCEGDVRDRAKPPAEENDDVNWCVENHKWRLAATTKTLYLWPIGGNELKYRLDKTEPYIIYHNENATADQIYDIAFSPDADSLYFFSQSKSYRLNILICHDGKCQ